MKLSIHPLDLGDIELDQSFLTQHGVKPEEVGTVIIAGDSAMELEGNVRRGVPPGIVDSMAETLDGLRLLAKEDHAGKRILPTHDAAVFQLDPDGL